MEPESSSPCSVHKTQPRVCILSKINPIRNLAFSSNGGHSLPLGSRTVPEPQHSSQTPTQLLLSPQGSLQTEYLYRIQEGCLSKLNTVRDKAKIILRLTVSRPVCLGVRQPPGAHDQIYIIVRLLRVCWCGAPSLTRGRISSSSSSSSSSYFATYGHSTSSSWLNTIISKTHYDK
jgi:hypothetical protein